MAKTEDGRWREDKKGPDGNDEEDMIEFRVRLSQSPSTRGDLLADFRTCPNVLHSSTPATLCSDQRCASPALSHRTPTCPPHRRDRPRLRVRPLAALRCRSRRSPSSTRGPRAPLPSRLSSASFSRRLFVLTTLESSAQTGSTGDRNGEVPCEATARLSARSR